MVQDVLILNQDATIIKDKSGTKKKGRHTGESPAVFSRHRFGASCGDLPPFINQFNLTRMQTFDLMTGYNIELRIKVNRRWEELENRQIDFTNPTTVLQLAQNWAEEQSRRIAAEKMVKKLTPKAELMDKVLDADEKIDVGQASKILELPFGRNTLFQKLREKGIFFKNRNEPKQEYVERGFFQLKEKFIERNNHEGFVVIKILVTQKGLEFIANLFKAEPDQKLLALIG